MLTLGIGLAMFNGLHVVPAMPALRERLRAAMGVGFYKGAFSVLSAASLVVIVHGYRAAHGGGVGNVQLWALPDGLRGVTTALMLPAFILLAAAYIPSRIRTVARHPMLAGVALWGLAHLLVRGDLASVLLFGSFLAFAVLDRISAERRAAKGPLGAAQGGLKGDIAAVVFGLGAFVAMVLWLHGAMTGVALLPGR